jgi:hypothetical protein
MAPPPRGSGAKRWVMTLNNYTEEDEAHLAEYFNTSQFVYAIVGREVGENGTPHLQCYFILVNRHNLVWLRNHVHARAHYEVARGTPREAAEYCKKEEDYDEYGTLPSGKTGTGAMFEDLIVWAKAQTECPSERDIAEAFPSLFGRYRNNVMDMVRMFAPKPVIQTGDLRDWQIELKAKLDGEADDRKVIFVVDEAGCSGKSFFCRWMLSNYPEETQLLGPAKRDDLAHIVQTDTKYFLLNIPRGNMEYLNYGFLESLKDRVVISPKYMSQTKILKYNPHVVVFTNEQVDMTKMTADRYDIIEL